MTPDEVRNICGLTIEFLKRTDLKGVENQTMSACFTFLNAFITGELQVVQTAPPEPTRAPVRSIDEGREES